MNAHQFIKGYEQVLKAFGHWPSFHDGEVYRVVLDRTRKTDSGDFYPSVELVIHGWNMTSEITEGGYYKLEQHHLVHFLFEHVTDFELDGLNHQNVLSSLDLALAEDEKSSNCILSVELAHCYGLSGSFKARQAQILSVIPCADDEAR
jgi:hypothetical protein